MPNPHTIKMRTSNKILIGLLLGILALFTAQFLGLQAALRNKNFVDLEIQKEERFNIHYYKDIKQVSISGLYRVTIYPSDTLKVEVDKRGKDEIQFSQKDNLLVIEAIANRQPNTGMAGESGREVNLYLPAMDSIAANRSELWVMGTKDSTQALSYNLYLENTGLNRREYREQRMDTLFYRNLHITGKNSTIEFSAGTTAGDVTMDLQDARFNDQEYTKFNTLRIQADSTSTVTLRGNNLKKAQLITKE